MPGISSEDPPKCACVGEATPYAATVPYTMPTAQPASSAHRWNQRVNRPPTSAGNVWRIQMPPSSWKLIATVLSIVRTKISAPTLTSSETNLETWASCFGVASGLMKSL